MIDLDTPDLEEALAADADGSFRTSLLQYLEEWRQKIRHAQSTPLTPADYDALARLSDSIECAGRLVDFFVKMKVVSANNAEVLKP